MDNILKQNLPKGLTLALVKALNDSGVRAQVSLVLLCSEMSMQHQFVLYCCMFLKSCTDSWATQHI